MASKLKLVKGDTLRDECLQDFWTFCSAALEMPLQEKPHREMVDFLSDLYSPNMMMLVPRDCWKTSLGSTALPLWMVLRAYFLDGNPAYRVIIDSSTSSLSKKVLNLIKSNIQYKDSFREIFGDLYDRKGDQQDALSLSFRVKSATGKKEPNFLASGVNSAKVGLHAELIVLDDLVSPINYRTTEQRSKVYDHFRLMQGVIESDPTGQKTRLMVIGTRYHDDDLYGRIIKNEKEGISEGKHPIFSTMIRGAIDEAGELFAPGILDKAALDRKHRQMKGLFYGQYMNDPNADDAPFKPESLNWTSVTQFPPLYKIRLSVDPAFKDDAKVHGDFSAFVVTGYDRFGQLYIIDVTLDDAMTPTTFVDELIRLSMRYDVESVIVEDDRSMSAMYVLIEQAMIAKGFRRRIDRVKANSQQGKQNRWLDIQTYSDRSGGVRIAEEIKPTVKQEIQDQWDRAPFATYDDFMDALALSTLFLPLDFGDSDDGGVTLGKPAREGMEIIANATSGTGPDRPFGTLADMFPHIKALRHGYMEDAVQADENLEDPQAIIERRMAELVGHVGN